MDNDTLLELCLVRHLNIQLQTMKLPPTYSGRTLQAPLLLFFV